MKPADTARIFAFVFFSLAANGPAEEPHCPPVAAPPAGRLYHGFYFSANSDTEHNVNAKDVARYEQSVGRDVTWVFFSDNWCEDRRFPAKQCAWIRELGKIPYVRLMLRSDFEQNHAEKVFTLDAILAGRFDADLKKWAGEAKQFGSPMLVEWGTECNGEWFAWNGKWNGRAMGAKKFVLAWRHIVTLIRGAGANNITWVWHVNNTDAPDVKWNRFENYYPGDDYVDWLAVSAYGPQTPMEKGTPERLRAMLDEAYPRLAALAPSKPLILAEFGCVQRHPKIAAADWAGDALADLLGNRWPRIAGFCWWNEAWPNDDNKKHDTDMIILDDPALAGVFRTQLSAAKERIQEKPVFGR